MKTVKSVMFGLDNKQKGKIVKNRQEAFLIEEESLEEMRRRLIACEAWRGELVGLGNYLDSQIDQTVGARVQDFIFLVRGMSDKVLEKYVGKDYRPLLWG